MNKQSLLIIAQIWLVAGIIRQDEISWACYGIAIIAFSASFRVKNRP